MPWGHVISTDTVPYTILSEIDPILGESYPVPAKQRTEVGGDLANRFEWRYFLRRLQSNKGKSSKAVAQIGRKLRVNGENLLTLEYDRDTSTVAIFMDDKVELLNVTYDRMARPVRWGPRSGIFADVELDYDRFNRLTSWRWGQLNETYGFDRAGRLHEIRYGDGSSLAYSFRDMFTSLPLKRFAGSQTVPADTPAALNRATIKKSDVNSEISSPKLIHILSERKAELEMCLLSVPVKSKHVFMFAGLL
ncbi:unnamed protein product [Pieris brassicae]|uniref:Teneurin-like YD-shell domain-containing protein n=1 Tax=Pieris brassicae TaxID=7116 RepID=A0A9P0TG61_PIEBR|nr:unnamed protein product [Pieris brassicae]